MFKVGDKVRWESQAVGSRTRKEGTIFRVIPSENFVSMRKYEKTHKVMYDGGYRNHESYLIEVPWAMSSKAKSRLYWPRVSQLRKVEGK